MAKRSGPFYRAPLAIFAIYRPLAGGGSMAGLRSRPSNSSGGATVTATSSVCCAPPWMTPRMGEDYVTLAIGRDFSDVSPMRGVIQGGAQHTLDVAVTVAPPDELEGRDLHPAIEPPPASGR